MVQAVITDTPPAPLRATIPPEVPSAAKAPPAANGASRHPVSAPRRFERPDIERHGAWLVPRFTEAFPHLSNHQAMSFMVNVLFSNEFLFLYQDHGVALAQVMNEHTLQPRPIVWERFVFLADPSSPRHVEEGALFYDEFVRWAKQKQAETLVVEQQSDVPREVIKTHVGRVFVQEMQVARL